MSSDGSEHSLPADEAKMRAIETLYEFADAYLTPRGSVDDILRAVDEDEALANKNRRYIVYRGMALMAGAVRRARLFRE